MTFVPYQWIYGSYTSEITITYGLLYVSLCYAVCFIPGGTYMQCTFCIKYSNLLSFGLLK